MKHYSSTQIKLTFAEPKYSVIGKNTVKCELEYYINVPWLNMSKNGFNLDVFIEANKLTSVGLAKLSPGDEFDYKVGCHISSARAEEAAYRRAYRELNHIKDIITDYFKFCDNFEKKASSVIDHNIEFAANAEHLSEFRKYKNECAHRNKECIKKKENPVQLELFDEDTSFVGANGKVYRGGRSCPRRNLGKDHTPVVYLQKEGDRFKVKSIALNRVEMEKITGIDARLVSRSSKYHVPVGKRNNSDKLFYRLADLITLFDKGSAMNTVFNSLNTLRRLNKENKKVKSYVFKKDLYLTRPSYF